MTNVPTLEELRGTQKIPPASTKVTVQHETHRAYSRHVVCVEFHNRAELFVVTLCTPACAFSGLLPTLGITYQFVRLPVSFVVTDGKSRVIEFLRRVALSPSCLRSTLRDWASRPEKCFWEGPTSSAIPCGQFPAESVEQDGALTLAPEPWSGSQVRRTCRWHGSSRHVSSRSCRLQSRV